MVRILSVSAAIVAFASTGAYAGKHKGKQQSVVGRVLGGLMSGAGLAAALEGSTHDVHPLWHSTQNDLARLTGSPDLMEDRFQMWAQEESKPYVTLMEGTDDSDVQIGAAPGLEKEYEYRLAAFAQNVANAKEYNVQSEGHAVHGITKFMDMEEAEFMKQRGGLNVDDEALAEFKKLPKAHVGGAASSSEFLGEQKKYVTGSKDWSAEGYTTPIKDQGQCGSCWAFSTTEQVESMAIKEGITDDDGSDYVLAPQELVSCDHNGDMGCQGGLPLNAMKWLETKPLEQESDYPYFSGITGTSGRCKLKKSKGVMEVTSFKQISSGASTEETLHEYLLTEGPASVGVDANNQWQTYIGGVMHASQCMGRMDHAVQAVGINTDAAVPYIKVRNSWAASWGENGYIRLKAGTNTCGIANMAVTADVKKVGEDITV